MPQICDKKATFTEIMHHLLEDVSLGEHTIWCQLLWHKGPARKVRVKITRQFFNRRDQIMVAGTIVTHTKWGYLNGFRFEMNTETGLIEYFAS